MSKSLSARSELISGFYPFMPSPFGGLVEHWTEDPEHSDVHGLAADSSRSADGRKDIGCRCCGLRDRPQVGFHRHSSRFPVQPKEQLRRRCCRTDVVIECVIRIRATPYIAYAIFG